VLFERDWGAGEEGGMRGSKNHGQYVLISLEVEEWYWGDAGPEAIGGMKGKTLSRNNTREGNQRETKWVPTYGSMSLRERILQVRTENFIVIQWLEWSIEGGSRESSSVFR